MKVPFIQFENIDFEVLKPVRVKTHRWLFHHQTKPEVYKIFAPGWEFADQARRGLETGCYDEALVPNLLGLIVDQHQNNRGYVMSRVPVGRILSNVDQPVLSPRTWLSAYQGNIKYIDIVWPRLHLQPTFFIQTLHKIISRAVTTGLLFAEISPANMWIGRSGYHLFDLDALRETDWLFEKNKDHPEFIRRLLNRECINADIKLMTARHGLRYPGPFTSNAELADFWPRFAALNNISAERLLP